MKLNPLKSATLALLPAALLAINSCSPTIPGEQSTTVKKSATGTTVVDTFKASASALASSSEIRLAIIASARACSSSRERPPRAPPATTDAPTALDAAAAHDEVL